MAISYALKPLRKPDVYNAVTAGINGMITVKGARSIGQFFFRTRLGVFNPKSNWDCALSTMDAMRSYEFPTEFVEQVMALDRLQNLYPEIAAGRWTFQKEDDPGHGWLCVPIWFLQDLGIADKISPYSYLSRDRMLAYLEEDCDFDTFWQTFEQKFGHAPKYTVKHVEGTNIRNMRSYHVTEIAACLKTIN